MVKKSADRTSRLDAVRKKLAQTDIGGGGYWKPKQGRNTVRILPGVGEMGVHFWQDVGKHYVPESRRSFTCPKFTIGEECPICEFVDELYKAGDEGSKALAKALRRRKQFWMTIVDRSNEQAGPQIFTPGPMIFKQIAALVMDPDYGDAVFDDEDGLDIVITRTGEMLETEYKVFPKRKATPLHDDDDTYDEWFDAVKDLAVVELTDDPAEDAELMGADCVVSVLPYDRLKAEFELLDTGGDEEEQLPFPAGGDDSDDVRGVIKRRRRARKSAVPRSRRRG